MTNIDTEIPGGNGPKPSRKGNGKGSKSKSFRKGNGKTDTSTARSTPIELTVFLGSICLAAGARVHDVGRTAQLYSRNAGKE
jgi:hypothetical protein